MPPPVAESSRPRRLCATVRPVPLEPSSRALVRFSKKRKTGSSRQVLSAETVDDSDEGDEEPVDEEPPADRPRRSDAPAGPAQRLIQTLSESSYPWSEDDINVLDRLVQTLAEAPGTQRPILVDAVKTATDEALRRVSPLLKLLL